MPPVDPRRTHPPTTATRMASSSISQDVFSSPSLVIGRFRCPPQHERWQSENRMDGPPTVVFPRVPVRINQAGMRSVVADANCVMFYNSGQAYTRNLLTNRGDECEYFSVSPEIIAELIGEFEPSLRACKLAPFRFPNGPSDAASYLRQRRLFEQVASGEPLEPLHVQETFFEILRGVIALAFAAQGRTRRPKRQDTSQAHAEIAEAAKESLARRYRQHLTLEDIADIVHSSPYHLCRIFRKYTGLSIHLYVDHLRLRAALESLSDPSVDLTTLALQLGYSSHSHFTFAFRRLFGITPSAVRGARSLRKFAAKTSRILTA